MVAMSLLLLCFEPATTAASMAICRPRTIGDAPEGPQRSGGRCRSDFLASRGMGEALGKKVAATALRLRRSRRSRSSARSSHHRGPVRRVLKRNPGEEVANLGSAVQEVGTVGRRERNRMRQIVALLPGETSVRSVVPRRCGAGLTSRPCRCSEETITFLRSGPNTLRADLRKPVRYREWEDYPSRVAAARTG